MTVKDKSELTEINRICLSYYCRFIGLYHYCSFGEGSVTEKLTKSKETDK